ncbi:Putative mediator complex subunit Med13, mediator complex, subunit Med13, MID domain of medPIWI [Septoria linicola]|uniref:Mediator of RNA polymerase II transcription subunit 13 n=1 Tax=Septoria linicola TaxID=215465 RepID=A0A9Q9AEK1_9PEZI|nr:Putative mediator complex subunit Med13, mediator complex, subunit Med13, MID domain of medPIWI [Septoria linicola]
MDFLKACTTNIHVVENVGQVSYTLYQPRDHGSAMAALWSQLQNIMASLRAESVLCAALGLHLYVFAHTVDPASALHEDFDVAEHGTIGSPASLDLSTTTSLRHIFQTAIELSLAATLAEDPAIVHVAPWTWLYKAGGSMDLDHLDNIVITLRIRTTAADGWYLISDVKPASFESLDTNHEHNDAAIVLAPFGLSARLSSTWSEKSLVSSESWKVKVAHTLQAQAIRLPDDVMWVAVELLNADSEACVWPANLCFTSSSCDGLNVNTFGADSDWRRWFISTEEGAIFRNPLAMTEEWFKAAAEKERAIAQTDAAAPGDVNMIDAAQAARSLNVPTRDSELLASPTVVQRQVDQSSAMAGIYPTPPDGFVGGQSGAQQGAATPSVSQPALSNAITSTSPVHDMSTHTPAGLTHDDSEDLGVAHEDLFGDVGEIGFGDAEVDDVDFSFFDEPDDVFGDPPQADGSAAPDAAHDPTRATDEAQPTSSNTQTKQVVGPEIPPVAASPQTNAMDTADTGHQDTSLEGHDSDDGASPVLECSTLQQRRPLSPFGIRERLLPPPIPASHSQSQFDSSDRHANRRNSSFTPITFRDSFKETSRYSAAVGQQHQPRLQDSREYINPTVPLASERIEEESDTSDSSDSEEEPYEPSLNGVDEKSLPPPLPWETRKRKRPVGELRADAPFEPHLPPWSLEENAEDLSNPMIDDQLVETLQQYTSNDIDVSGPDWLYAPRPELDKLALDIAVQAGFAETAFMPLPSIGLIHELSRADIVCVAQLIGEQSATTASPSFMTAYCYEDISIRDTIARYVRGRLSTALQETLPDSAGCDLADIALSKDSHLRQGANPAKIGHPRPPQRLDSMQTGPDLFLLPPPHLKLHRGPESWELLPSCIPFWEPLGLGPAAGPKNVRAFCVFPFNEDLQRLVDQFLRDMGTAYENCKLGTHVHMRNVSELEQDNFEDGMAPVELGEDASLEAALKAYASTCSDLGKALATISHHESGDRAVVVYILNPFVGRSARQHMCACFWILFQAYRDNMSTKPRDHDSSDVVLQLLPINLVASCDAFVPLDSAKMSALAREVYDRCPPTSALQLSDVSAPLPILAAPTVELASTAPKRLGFQLASEAPSDLLFEGSILHLAYAYSPDRKWLTASWIDSTGKHQSSSAFGLVGRTFAEVANDVWEHTRTILSARQVLWRVFIVAQDVMVDASVLQCWRVLAAKPRPQPVCVTLLSVQDSSLLQLLTPHVVSEQLNSGAAENGVLTPASTPQGGVFTSSPDVSGHAGNAPLTPAASESASSLPTDSAMDVESQLMDMTDETWGVMLTPKLSSTETAGNMAHGVLFKRGRAAYSETEQGETMEKLPSLGVSLHWTIQVKTQGTVDEGSTKQAELTLREVLRMYRGLAQLTKARGLHSKVGGFAPLHIVLAVAGAAGLEGLALDDEENAMLDASQ